MKGFVFQAGGAERCTPEAPTTNTLFLLLCTRCHTPPPITKKGSRVERFRKTVWRDCFQAHWDAHHDGIIMPADLAAALRLAPEEVEWCGVLAAGGKKIKTAKRKRAAAVSQAEAEEATRAERSAPAAGVAASVAAGARKAATEALG